MAGKLLTWVEQHTCPGHEWLRAEPPDVGRIPRHTGYEVRMIRVSHIIANRARPFILDAKMTIAEASRFLRKHHVGGAPVTEGGRLVGFCSERDIVYRLVGDGRDPDKTVVAEIMSTNVITAGLGDTALECEDKMRKAHVRHLPIVEDGEVVACISLRNVLKSELAEYKLEVDCLTDYIRGS